MKKYLKRIGVFVAIIAMVVTMLPMTMLAGGPEESAEVPPVVTEEETETPAEVVEEETETPAEVVEPTETLAEFDKPTETPAGFVKPTETPSEGTKNLAFEALDTAAAAPLAKEEEEPEGPFFKHNGQKVKVGDVFNGADENYFTLRDNNSFFARYNKFTLVCGDAQFESNDKVWFLPFKQYGAYISDLNSEEGEDVIDLTLNYKVVGMDTENRVLTIAPLYFYSTFRQLEKDGTIAAGETVYYLAWAGRTEGFQSEEDFELYVNGNEEPEENPVVPDNDRYYSVTKIDGNKIYIDSREYQRASVDNYPVLKTKLTYNLLPQALISRGTASNGTMYYGVSTDEEEKPTSYSWNIPSKTNAGTYYVWYKIVGNRGYNDAEPVRLGKVEIAKKVIDVNWYKDGDFTYDGKPHDKPIAYVWGWDLLFTQVKSVEGEETLKNAGKYTYEAVPTNENCVFSRKTRKTTVKVHKADLWVKLSTKPLTYVKDGQDFPEAKFKEVKGEDEISYEIVINKYNGKNSGKKHQFSFENAGTYDLEVKLTEDSAKNYKLHDTKAKVTINKLTLFVPNGLELTYNGQEQIGVVADEELIKVVGGAKVNAGHYTATLKLKDRTNYQWAGKRPNLNDKKVDFVILKKEIDAGDFNFTAPEDLSFTGKGKAEDVKVALKKDYAGEESGNKLVYWLENAAGDIIKDPTQPGTYYVMATIEGTGRGKHRVVNFKGGPVEIGEFTIAGVEITKGDESTYTLGSNGTLKFVSNGPFDLFKGVRVDGKVVDPENYTAEAGSTIITFNKEYSESLTAGEHTIQFVFGEIPNVLTAEGTFTVQAAASPAPKTGDTNSMGLWMTLAILSILAIAGVALTFAKREN